MAVIGRRVLLSRAFLCYTSLARSKEAPTIALPPLREGEKRLYLCRHGETNWNLENRIQGTTDNPLNANGEQQAEALSAFLAREPIDTIISSNLQRASQTADAVACKHSKAIRKPGSASFAEMCFGDYEGQRLDDFEPTYQSYLASWRSGDTGRRWPGALGESPDQVAARGLDGIRELGLLDPTRPDRYILVAAHGRFNKILIAALRGDLARASEVQQGNCAVNVIDLAPDGKADVRALDVRDHLQGAVKALA